MKSLSVDNRFYMRSSDCWGCHDFISWKKKNYLKRSSCSSFVISGCGKFKQWRVETGWGHGCTAVCLWYYSVPPLLSNFHHSSRSYPLQARYPRKKVWVGFFWGGVQVFQVETVNLIVDRHTSHKQPHLKLVGWIPTGLDFFYYDNHRKHTPKLAENKHSSNIALNLSQRITTVHWALMAFPGFPLFNYVWTLADWVAGSRPTPQWNT